MKNLDGKIFAKSKNAHISVQRAYARTNKVCM